MTIELLGDALADKYETKRDGLTCDEALEATVLGYKVRSPSIAPNAYIHYPGEGGWRIQFVHDGRDGSSSGWIPDRCHWLELWSIVPDREEVKRDAWGKPVQQYKPDRQWPVDDRKCGLQLDKWGRPIA
jgi:hypothetical protein